VPRLISLAGRRKISPELGVVREHGEGVFVCVCCALGGSRAHDCIYTPPRLLFLFCKKKRKLFGPGTDHFSSMDHP
jgi:hypothetical protein